MSEGTIHLVVAGVLIVGVIAFSAWFYSDYGAACRAHGGDHIERGYQMGCYVKATGQRIFW